MLEIKLGKQPEKFLKKCEKILFDRIVSKLEELKSDPVPHDAKRVQGYNEPTFRMRIGDYRVLYRSNHEKQRIIIGKRDKVHQA